MSQTPLLDKLNAAREEILTGEVGALLHDIGKLDSRFPKSKSQEGGVTYHHEQIKNEKVVSADLIKLFESVDMTMLDEKIKVLDLIQKHHKRNHQEKLISALSQCDGIDSGDDKGVVRKKQPTDNTVIVSAFGREKSKIDLNCLDNYLRELDKDLTEIFNLYSSGKTDGACFRNSVLKAIEKPFSNALGETRIPANDVTLFDHSFSTASLYKTRLARAILKGDIDTNEEWRVFGIFWNGTRFISQARKVADALKRQGIVEAISERIRCMFEVEYPIGNAVFADNDSIFFTFPAFDKSEELAKECIEMAVEIIKNESDNDLWPICALSQSRRSPTVIAEMMEFFETKKGIEKESSVLHIWENGKFKPENSPNIKNPLLEPKIRDGNEKYDICPVCRIRAKKEADETCNVCLDRRRGRIKGWAENRDKTETIWVDEVADENNRIALISMEFEIGKWMDGTFVNTLFSQSFEDWANNKKLVEHGRPKDYQKEALEHLDFVLYHQNNREESREERAKRLNGFFEDVKVDQNNLDTHLKNIAKKFGKRGDELTANDLFNYLFHKQPSPARLRRIWTETQGFIDEIQKQMHELITHHKRITIEVESEPEGWEELDTGKMAELEGLIPDNLPVVYLGNKKFISIVNFEGYKSGENLRGLEAVKEFLEKSKDEEKSFAIKKDDSEKESDIKITGVEIEKKPYIPATTLTKSPYQFQMLVPATSIPGVLEVISSFYDNWFSNVTGKLPLKVGVLGANRKFPLYVLLDSASRMLKSEGFKETILIEPYWDVNGQRIDPYYGYYPTDKGISPKKLTPIKNGRKFHLNLGYFDFDFLGGTADRGRIFYQDEGSQMKRKGIRYGWIEPRPHYLHKIKDMLKLRDVFNQLSKTQVNGIEQALIDKLGKWNYPDESNKPDQRKVYHEFAKAVLIDALTSEKWGKMSHAEKGLIEDAVDSGLLLDTIQLFNHVLKVKIGGDEG